jgi:hypothetical protein
MGRLMLEIGPAGERLVLPFSLGGFRARAARSGKFAKGT